MTTTPFARPTAIVVGSGIAGLVVALRATRTHEVTLITKAELGESNTRYAQGGIAAALFPDDSVESHVADTLVAGAGLNRLSAVEVLCAEGPQRIRDLISWGVEFDRAVDAASGDDVIAGLARGLEAAHSHPRIMHAGGDATGAAIESALVRAVRATTSTLLEYTFVADLLVDKSDESSADEASADEAGAAGAARRVVGVSVIGPDGVARELHADAVILASGGAGQLFAHTTNPEVTTGDGVAAAYRAGAQLADVEFYQFHPTSLAVPGNFLISEAVRGEGAVLRGSDGRRFMPAVHPDAELAPRDVVARAIAEQMHRQGGAPVLLDATALGGEFLARRFPSITEACRRNGLDWAAAPIPVTPAAHYWMGGVLTDDWGRTSLPGLYAVGEVACTGVHGANRLASNSLLESVVFAWRCVEALQLVPAGAPFAGEGDFSGRDELLRGSLSSETLALDAEAQAGAGAGTGFSRLELQQLMWDNVGVYRDAETLEHALSTLESWASNGAQSTSAETARGGATLHDRENANLLLLGTLITRSALAREESRGAHFRSDFPEPREELRHHIVSALETSERKVTVSL
ncbi:L-aspartate oxidase [Subtercola endophyticus]|uniref:L-aspartate oxidase n=1 Tax=Subtercola endophyticus TaxID=2895559 RepID=UPI001E4AD6C7|nr:L-aspartate oxidase [Subtercola endophyticus]UFS59993.1 L-aspartate oxidase [Subtercola endophyticus]